MGHERRFEMPTPTGTAPRREDPPKRQLDPGKLVGVVLDRAKVAELGIDVGKVPLVPYTGAPRYHAGADNRVSWPRSCAPC